MPWTPDILRSDWIASPTSEVPNLLAVKDDPSEPGRKKRIQYELETRFLATDEGKSFTRAASSAVLEYAGKDIGTRATALAEARDAMKQDLRERRAAFRIEQEAIFRAKNADADKLEEKVATFLRKLGYPQPLQEGGPFAYLDFINPEYATAENQLRGFMTDKVNREAAEARVLQDLPRTYRTLDSNGRNQRPLRFKEFPEGNVPIGNLMGLLTRQLRQLPTRDPPAEADEDSDPPRLEETNAGEA